MHQDHNIPWYTLSQNFAVVSKFDHTRRTDHTDLYPLDKPNQAKEFEYFSVALVKAIQEFATTERQKYPETFPIEETGKLFSDELLESASSDIPWPGTYHEDYLTKQNQKIEYWISCARDYAERCPESGYPPFVYTTSNLGLASVVKCLIIKNQMSPLLMLANHPSIPLKDLYMLSWGHSFGWSRLVDYALSAYIYINVLGEFPQLCKDAKYKKLRAAMSLMSHLTSTCDGDAQIVMHRPFILLPPEKFPKTGHDLYVDIFEDMGKLKEYLKSCFEVLYRCEMLARECNREIKWADEIACALSQLHVKTYWVDEGEGDCRYKSVYENPKLKKEK
ncbi:hypothetical protein BGX26_010349 [Mortierella sp. AD094]|nr:hypothetical protein BGX26_010349 [Mortierella sp. AD094]